MGETLFQYSVEHATDPEVYKPYLPFPVALEAGVIDKPIDNLAAHTAEPIGVTISNGLIPNPTGAGVVFGGGEFVVLDHTRLHQEGDRIFVLPSSKTDVDGRGRIQGAGAVVMTSPQGWLQVLDVVVDLNDPSGPWVAENNRQRGLRTSIVGHFAICSTGFDRPRLSIEDVDTKTGAMLVVPSIKFF